MLDWGDVSLLVDPMLSPAEAMDPIPNAGNDRRIPMVELPINDDELRAIIAGVDGVLVTHLHRDHWDARAAELIPFDKPLLTQPASRDNLLAAGFTNVTAIEDALEWQGLTLTRTGRHPVRERSRNSWGPSRALCCVTRVVQWSIWLATRSGAARSSRRSARMSRPSPSSTLVVRSSILAAPITMTIGDVSSVRAALPSTRVVAVHMDTINHCHETRAKLAAALSERGLADRVTLPADGESLEL